MPMGWKTKNRGKPKIQFVSVLHYHNIILFIVNLARNILNKRKALESIAIGIDCDIALQNCPSVGSDALLTIAIPTYRRPELLAEALESCRRQSHNRFRVIVVDNDSTPEFASRVDDVVRKSSLPDIKLFRNTVNVGMFGNWNRCLALTETPFVCILNDDDLLAPDYVKCIVELIVAHPDADLLQTGYSLLDRRLKQSIYEVDHWNGIESENNSTVMPLDFRKLCISNTRAGCLGITYRVEFVKRIGGFDPNEYPTADYCFNARVLANRGCGYEVRNRLAAYRIGDNESLKPHTLLGFIVNDYRLRREAAHFFKLSFIMDWYAHFTVSTQRHALKKMWRHTISSDDLQQQIGIRPVDSVLLITIFRAVNIVLRRLLMI